MRAGACVRTTSGGSECVSAGGRAIIVSEERVSASVNVSNSVRFSVRVGTSAHVSSSMSIGVSTNVEICAS